MSDKYSQIDVSDPQEPDYMTRFDEPIVMPDFEKWSKEHEVEIEEKEEYYE